MVNTFSPTGQGVARMQAEGRNPEVMGGTRIALRPLRSSRATRADQKLRQLVGWAKRSEPIIVPTDTDGHGAGASLPILQLKRCWAKPYYSSAGGNSEPVTRAVAAVSNVYEVAKAGGPHHGWLEKQRKLPTAKLFKSIRSLEKQIALHYEWINDPYLKVPAETSSGEVDYYVKIKWPGDIQRQRHQIEILRGVLRERGIDQT